LGLRQIFEINFINTAGLRRMNCGVKFVRPAVGLRLIFDNFMNTAGVRIKICGVHFMLDPLWDLDWTNFRDLFEIL
jgi:hypothetical protein